MTMGGFEDKGGGMDLSQHPLPIDEHFNRFVEKYC